MNYKWDFGGIPLDTLMEIIDLQHRTLVKE
jgi:hypothetical protein